MLFEQINITELNLNSNTNPFSILNRDIKRLNCDEVFLEVYDGSTSIQNKLHSFCNSNANKVLKSQSNKVFMHFKRNSDDVNFQFKLFYNPYKIGKKIFNIKMSFKLIPEKCGLWSGYGLEAQNPVFLK